MDLRSVSEGVERSATARRTRSVPLTAERVDARAAGAWLCAFAVVLYLGVSGGGYDPVVHSEVGIALWWIVLAGTACGVLSVRFGRIGWAGFGLLAGFVAWTAFGMTWTESAERTAAELARVA